MKRTRIVLAGMSRMTLEIMDRVIASHPDLYVAGRVPADDDLRDGVHRYRADVLIVQRDAAGLESSADRMFWRRPSKVIAITESGREGVLLVLRPYTTALRELSVDSLVEAIRSDGNA